MILKKYKSLWILAFAVILITSCESDEWDLPVEEVTPLTAGTANLSTYVSVGNSLTAGYTDGALFVAGQMTSMPNLLAQQFALLGGGAFTQPMTNDNIGGLLLGGTIIQEPRLYFNGAGPVRLDAMPTNEITAGVPGPYNNMGVPGAKSFHLLANGYGNVAGVATGQASPYYARMASSSNAAVIEDAVAMNPTFFSLWIGNNDVLSYATSGGAGVDQTGNYDPSTYGPNDITDPIVFGGTYSALLGALTANGSQGVAMNVPYVTTIPYFTTVPHNPVPLDAATAAQLNGAFAPYNGGLLAAEAGGLITASERAARTINFVEGYNAVTMVDEYLTDLGALGLPSYRHATANDLVVLPASSFIGSVVNNDPTLINGVSVPLEDNWVLSANETSEVTAATNAYNGAIAQLVSDSGIAFIDANAIMQEIAAGGIQFDEFNMQSNLVFGMTFSLDGVHPTQRGYAFMANEIMKAIDATYGSNFEEAGALLKAADYTTFYPEGI